MGWGVLRRLVVAGLCAGPALLMGASPLLAGAWTLPAGRGQSIVTGTFSTATRFFDAAAALRVAPRYNKFELNALLEYGATDRVTVMVAPGAQHVDIAEPAAQRTGLGYSEIGARARLAGGTLADGSAWVLSGQTLLRVPGTFERANPAAVGYSEPELDVRGLAGYSFAAGPFPAFVDLQVAQRFRFGAPPDELRVDLSFGLRPAAQWLLLAQSFNVFSEGAGQGFPSYRYHKFQLSAVYDVTTALSLQLGGFTTYAGRNALQENALILGAWYRF
jgi:protein XagA